jgi:hypothetical protein
MEQSAWKLIVPEFGKKLPAVYDTQRFTDVFTIVHLWS